MRTRILVPVGALLAVAMLPLAARGSTTSGDLVLSPAQGAPGSHFTATFTFNEAPCDAYLVGFYWDPPNPGAPLGHVDATGAGPTCTVSMDLTVPLTDATPNHSYEVGASAQTKQVDTGGASATTWSSKDSGVSQFEVTSPAPPGSTGGTAPPASSHTTTASSRAATGTSTSPTTDGSSASATDSTSSDGASPSPDLVGGSPSSTGNGNTPALDVASPRAPAGGGMGGAIVVAAALLVLATALVWLYRSGRLRNLLHR